MSARLAAKASLRTRHARSEARRAVAAGASLASLIEAAPPELAGVRCYQLVCWLPMVAERKSTRILRGLPGHVRIERLTERQREILAQRCRAYEERRARRAGNAP